MHSIGLKRKPTSNNYDKIRIIVTITSTGIPIPRVLHTAPIPRPMTNHLQKDILTTTPRIKITKCSMVKMNRTHRLRSFTFQRTGKG